MSRSRSYPRHLAFPFRIGDDGRPVATATRDEHVRDEILQLILTTVGERAFVPEFGTNVRRLTFENLDQATQSLTKATVTQALSRWLGGRVTVEELDVTIVESTLAVELRYRLIGAEDSRTLRFQRGGA
jgi:phage baseplate assembly protein W